MRNMRSIGIELQPHVGSGRLRFHAARPTLHGLEMHLATVHREVDQFNPDAVILDPATNFIASGNQREAHSLLMRIIDFLKTRKITGIFNSLTSGGQDEQSTETDVSSLMDVWLLLRSVESNGERNRLLYVLKARGMNHSNQVREFLLTDQGVHLIDVYLGPEGVLTGSARLAQEARLVAANEADRLETERRRRDLQRRRRVLQGQIAALQAELETDEDEFAQHLEQQAQRQRRAKQDRSEMAAKRGADANGSGSE
jgi:circadian clock protein KaiC